jgi:hypothetical protein
MLTAFSRQNCLTLQERTLKNILILYLLMKFLAWFTIVCYVFFPEAFVVLNIPCLAGFILAPVFFFRIIRFLTRIETEEQFSRLHWLIPALIGSVFLFWSLFVPFDVHVELVKSRQLSIPGEYELYSRLFTSKPLLRIVFMTVYYSCIARLLVRYYHKASSLNSFTRKPRRWVVFLIVLSLTFMLSSLTAVLLPRNSIDTSIHTAITALIGSGQYMLLTFHIIRRKYTLYAVYSEPKAETETEAEPENGGRRLHSGKLTRRRLGAYFHKQKPYLQGNFKITDLAEAMDVNRSVISAFINKNYGVNFNRFVNSYRLKELERLQALPFNKGKSLAGLVKKAGFADLRQYFRAKQLRSKN